VDSALLMLALSEDGLSTLRRAGLPLAQYKDILFPSCPPAAIED